MTHFELLQVIAFVPNLLWFFAAWLVGKKRTIGWLLYIVSEGAWVALAISAHLWSILPWCGVAFVLYGHNFRKWRSEAA